VINHAMRGDVWTCRFPVPPGEHPAVVLTTNRIADRLSAVTVVLISGTAGPSVTHVAVGAEVGLTKYPESYVDCTSIHTVDKPRLRKFHGRLSSSEMNSVEKNIRVILGL
jgi:mRNA interferase MazF